jgi:TonB-linked SusC/RagA family outer membrane protein
MEITISGRGLLCAMRKHLSPQLRRVMRLTTILLAAISMHVSAGSFEQTVSFSGKDVPLDKVFAAIEKQTGLAIFFNYALIKDARPVTLNIQNGTVTEVLRKVLEGQGMDFYQQGKTIFITKQATESTAPVKGPSQSLDIQGRVTNLQGEPLAGASVMVKNLKKGTLTDEKGGFILHNIPRDGVLEITFTGYLRKEVPLNGQNSIDIVLKGADNVLDQVQIIPYGSTTQRLGVGDVTTIKASDIEVQPVSNPLLALEGRVTGLFITQNSGITGGNVSVQIRGVNSISQGTDPLYVVDGVPYSSELLTSVNFIVTNGGTSPLSFINPSDIESIEVLKDADATAIYGARGANGVILITTKKGKSGPVRFDVRAYSGVSHITKTENLMNSKQYLQMRDEAFANDGETPQPYDADVNGTWDSTTDHNWQKYFVGNNAQITDAEASLSGGNSLTQYLIGGGYHQETTVFPGNLGEQKISFHFNTNTTSNDRRFKANFGGIYLVDNNKLPISDYMQSISLPPDAPPVYNPDGTLNWADNTWSNPLANTLAQYKAKNNNLIGNALLSYSIVPGLEVKSSFGYSNLLTNEVQAYPVAYFGPFSGITTGNSNFSTNTIYSWVVEPQITYSQQWGGHRLNVLTGATDQETVSNGQIVDASGYTNDALIESLAAAATLTKGQVTNSDYKYASLFSRLNYSFSEKYLLDLTARRDGSSRFGPGRQFGNFGAVGAGWIFSKEEWVKRTLSGLSFGKIRASYGTVGNSPRTDYSYLPLYNYTSNNPYQGGQGLVPANLLSQDYSWEINRKLEGGLELGFLRDKILAGINYYINRTANQLVTYPVADVTGFRSIIANLPAEIQNDGWEFNLNFVNIGRGKFSWSSSFNLTISRNKLLSFPNLASSSYAYYYVIGKPLTILKTYKFAGVNDSTGVYQFSDQKGNVTYTPDYNADRTAIVNTAPKYFGGFQNTFKYKQLQLDLLFQFVKQIGLNDLFACSSAPGEFYYNQPRDLLNRWQYPGQQAKFQKYTQDYGSAAAAAYQYVQLSNAAYSDASYIRLKNLSLSYQFPEKWLQRAKVRYAQLFLQCQNVLTITSYKGIDPENQTINSLPPLRVFTGGIKLSL